MQIRRAFAAWAFLCALATPTYAIDTKADQLVALDAILAELKTHYGMIRFKEEHLGVSYEGLRAKYAELVNEAMTLEEKLGYTPRVSREVLPAEEFRQLMVALGAELRDGHTNISRQSFRGWTTGIQAAAIDGKLYITGFDPQFFIRGRSHPEPKVGDEIVAIDGVPVQELAQKTLMYVQLATHRARYHEALELLVNPAHRWCRRKETGSPVQFTFERPSAKGDEGKKLVRFEGRYHWIGRHDLQELQWFRQFVEDKSPEPEPDRPYRYGEWSTYQSFFQQGLQKLSLPPGSVIEFGKLLNAQIDEAKAAAKTKGDEKGDEKGGEARHSRLEPASDGEDTGEAAGPTKLLPNRRLHVQIVRYEGKQIGIVRIPDYSPFSMAAETQWLREAIKQLENATDALIIDQLSNGGGYVWHFAELTGFFAHERPMDLGTMEVKLSETFFATYEPAPSPDTHHEKFVNDQRLNFGHLTLHRRGMERLRQKYDAGERWSGPIAFGAPQTQFVPGSGTMFPRNDVAYTKPVLLLNDERSASGGDFFPATLQANGRAVIFGETSQGLGGPVYRRQASMPGSEMSMRCTYGICHRADGLLIENVGVVPDVLRPTTVDDLRGGFTEYAKDALKLAVRLASGETIAAVREAEAKKLEEAGKDAPSRPEFDEALRLLKELREALASEADLERAANRYQEDLERLVRVGLGDLEEAHWRALRIPIPLALAKSDPMLASVGDARALEERLAEMRSLPRYAEGTPLRRMVDALANTVPQLRKARVNPCLLALANQAPKQH